MSRSTDDDDAADRKARDRFRLFVVLYLVYPAIILGLLAVISAGAFIYITKSPGDETAIISGPQPAWCYPGSMAGYTPPPMPMSSGSGGFEPAIAASSGSFTPSINPQIGIPSIGSSVQAAGNSARERITYYVYVSLRAADGAQDARYQRSMIGLSQVELGVARQQFAERSRKDGRLGFIRLGITQLGGEAYDIADKNDLMVPFCAPNDFATQDKRQAYVNFAVASYCDTAGATRANDWLLALANFEGYTDEQKSAMQAEAANYLAGDPKACVVQLADTPPPGGSISDGDYYDDDYGNGSGYGGDYGSEPPPVETLTPPDFSRRGGQRLSEEEERAATARWWLNRGDADLNGGNTQLAITRWQEAIRSGQRYGAQAAITAQKRIQAHTLTCRPSWNNLRRISREYEELQGDLVDVQSIQRALAALGHYEGPINGALGPLTRSAIRKFQRELAFDETDTLTPQQTVLVICNAAQIARDPASQDILGIMYATGLGVRLNVDLALEWLRTAASRHHAKSSHHLAVIYGTGIVWNSYRLCDIPRNLQQADQYLREGAQQGYGASIDAWRRYGHRSPEARWRAIEDDMMRSPSFAKARELTREIGETCQDKNEDAQQRDQRREERRRERRQQSRESAAPAAAAVPLPTAPAPSAPAPSAPAPDAKAVPEKAS